jgi:uncharacterized protein YkwD
MALTSCQITAKTTLPESGTSPVNTLTEASLPFAAFSSDPQVTPVLSPTASPERIISATPVPDADPSPSAVPTLSPGPTAQPASSPTPAEKPDPTAAPTKAPTKSPTPIPTKAPTAAPTAAPSGIVINLPGVPDNWPLSSSQQKRVDEFISLVNQARAAEGIAPLQTGSSSLRQVAAIRAAEISILFSHDRPTDLETSNKWWHLLKAFKISYKLAGENITGGPSSPQAALTTFMNSPGHRGNILNPAYTTIAIGVYTDKNGKDWWVQEFMAGFN